MEQRILGVASWCWPTHTWTSAIARARTKTYESVTKLENQIGRKEEQYGRTESQRIKEREILKRKERKKARNSWSLMKKDICSLWLYRQAMVCQSREGRGGLTRKSSCLPKYKLPRFTRRQRKEQKIQNKSGISRKNPGSSLERTWHFSFVARGGFQTFSKFTEFTHFQGKETTIYGYQMALCLRTVGFRVCMIMNWASELGN